jgi:hypothetical protein
LFLRLSARKSDEAKTLFRFMRAGDVINMSSLTLSNLPRKDDFEFGLDINIETVIHAPLLTFLPKRASQPDDQNLLLLLSIPNLGNFLCPLMDSLSPR